MSCSCNQNPCCCGGSTPACDPALEPLASEINNLIIQLFGTLVKACVNNSVIWTLPCNLAGGDPKFPRLNGESILCYNLRYLTYLGGQVAGGGGTGFLLAQKNLSDVGNVATARANLGAQAACAALNSICALPDALGFLKNNGAGVLSWADTSIKYAVMQDLKADLTSGGAFVLGAWRKRDLQTIAFDPSSIITSLVASEFTLNAGDYIIRSICPVYAVGTHQARIYNVTNGVQLALGESMYAAALGPGSVSACAGFVSLATPKTFRIEHFSTSTNADGFGQPAGTGAGEVYTIVEVLKIK